MNPLMNETKWNEVRLAMYQLGHLSPQCRTLNVETGYLSAWDGEWFHHFQVGGYKTIEWVEIKVSSRAQFEAVRDALETVHVPGEKTEHGFKVMGYARNGVAVDYLTRFNMPLHPTAFGVG
ncbi:DUF6678 family protein [Pseudorhodoferax sp. LjRoot39]|uniref:DUF6678 family protein n=1 Tax=Pseudorhodoferax sp. LjRoot39 TaxID=3342328 RepID=UPI003F4FB1C4